MFSNAIIIDTRKVLSTKYKKVLKSINVEVKNADNLTDAYKFIQSNEPDLIIVSDSIPETLENFCQRIRVLTYNTRPIIIALSKSAEADDKIKILNSGADDFISEPVDIKEFKARIHAHIRREIDSNINRKTGLANKQYSIRVLKRTLLHNNDWAAILIEVDNYFPYKEVYTEIASDKVIQAIIAIMQSSLSDKDFLGQISENEFIMITHPASAEKIVSFLSVAFDAVASKFYSNEDAKRGYMLLQGDDFAGIRIPFLALYSGIISSEFDTYIDVEKLVTKLYQLKSMAKLPSNSNYIIERLKLSGEYSANNERFNNKIAVLEKDSALELLLKTTLELQGYEVISEIDTNVIPSIILIDSGNNLEGLKICTKLKNTKQFNNTKIIVTSIYHDKTLILNSGADLYIPKPYEISTIVKWVEYFVNQLKY